MNKYKKLMLLGIISAMAFSIMPFQATKAMACDFCVVEEPSRSGDFSVWIIGGITLLAIIGVGIVIAAKRKNKKQ